jgi:integrase/recombinase XerD
MTHLPPATSGTLRERLVADMAVRGFTEKTCKDYLRIVAGFAAFWSARPARRLPRTSAGSRSSSPSGA